MPTFYFSYDMQKLIEKHKLPLVIAFSVAQSIMRNQCNSMHRFFFAKLTDLLWN